MRISDWSSDVCSSDLTIRAAVDLNLLGSIWCARAAIRRMARRHGGRGGAIVNLSSGAATIGSPGEYVWYAASKGAIDSLTVGLAKENAGEGIHVNAVAPRSEEHTSELQSLMRISYAVFCLKKQQKNTNKV